MRKRLALIVLIALVGGLVVLPQVQASHVDTFTFFIPWAANELAAFFRLDGQLTGGGDPVNVTGIKYTIGISVLRADTIIYYDHWEDELEPNINFPVQSTTEVWGDGDPTNGAPPGNPGDTLSAGEIIILTQPEAPGDPPAVPVPRNSDDFFYDGGDKVSSVGGTIAINMSAWPDPSGGILFADAWELYPVARWENDYVSPIGENVIRPNGTPPGAGFSVTVLVVQAAHDDTTVEIDLNGDGTFDRVVDLDEGRLYNSIVDRPPNGLSIPVSAGARVRTSEPVQTLLFTKDPLSTYQARGFTLIPDGQWSADYLAPRSSDGDFWLFNPDTTDLEVQVQTTTGSTNVTIPGRNAGRYPPLPDPVLPAASGVRFTSTDGRPFYGVAALDADYVQDWGYSLLPTSYMSAQALVGWAPGNNNSPPDGDQSRVYVTALNQTQVFLDLDGDGVPDDSVDVPPLQEVDIVGYPDLTGARLYTTDGEPFLAVWGQDQGSPDALPSIDVGNNIVPLRAPSIQKSYTLLEPGYDCGTDSQGHRVQFQLLVFNDSANPVPNVVVLDNLGAGITYELGTTTLNGSSVLDDTSGTPFPLDEGGLPIGTLPPYPQGRAIITFDAGIEGGGVFFNEAELQPSDASASVELLLPFQKQGYEVNKALIDPADGLADPGQNITFGITISNTGSVDITQLPVRDEFDPDYLTSPSANPPFDVGTADSVAWNNLAPPGGLLPGEQVDVTMSFTVVDPLPPNALDTINVVIAAGVEGSDGFTQAIVCDEATVAFAVPTPTSTPTPTPTPPPDDGNGDGDDDDPTPTPRPPATPTPGTPPTPAPPAPTPPVLFLPETGVRGYSDTAPMWPLVVLPGLGLVLGWMVYRHRRDK